MPNFNFIQKVRPIRDLGDYQVNPESWYERFIDINSDIFLKDMPIKRLGSGFFGEAWETEDGNVFKIFQGIGTLKFYEEEKRSYDNGNEDALNVFEYGAFRIPRNTVIHYNDGLIGWAIMEKLSPLDEKPENPNYFYYVQILKRILSDISSEEPEFDTNSKESAKKILNYYLKTDPYLSPYKNLIYSDEFIKYRQSIINVISSALNQISMGRPDVKSENFGFRDDSPIYFDSYIHTREDSEEERQNRGQEIYWDNQQATDEFMGLYPGINVKITQGPFSGMTGIVKEVDEGGLIVTMNIFGRTIDSKLSHLDVVAL